ncbi:unnamed protein product [Calypogeia fissa]
MGSSGLLFMARGQQKVGGDRGGREQNHAHAAQPGRQRVPMGRPEPSSKRYRRVAILFSSRLPAGSSGCPQTPEIRPKEDANSPRVRGTHKRGSGGTLPDYPRGERVGVIRQYVGQHVTVQ